jgi:glucosamine--fructose-6-phosphate aminotransferase (isomerizing)
MREAGEFLLNSFPQKENDYFKETAIILISQSGESGEIVQLLKKLKSTRNPPFTIGITNSPESTLALETDQTFLTKAGEEKSVTSKTYTSTLLLLYILATNILGDFFSNPNNLTEIEGVIEELKKILNNFEKNNNFIDKMLKFFGEVENCLIILARGPSLSTAYQAALNFKEIVKIASEASPCSTFNHGGIECLNKNSKLIVISSDENNFNLNLHFIKKILNNWDCGKILHITNRELYGTSDYSSLSESPKFISFKHEIKNPFLCPIMEIVILQLIFYKMAEKRNIIPGKFNYTQKITREM